MDELISKTVEYVKDRVTVEFDGFEASVNPDDVEYYAQDYLVDVDEAQAETVMGYIAENANSIAAEIETEAENANEEALLNRESDEAEAFWY